MTEDYEKIALEAVDRIDNDGRPTREVLDWFAGQLGQLIRKWDKEGE